MDSKEDTQKHCWDAKENDNDNAAYNLFVFVVVVVVVVVVIRDDNRGNR
jgi:hypothetical protein